MWFDPSGILGILVTHGLRVPFPGGAGEAAPGAAGAPQGAAAAAGGGGFQTQRENSQTGKSRENHPSPDRGERPQGAQGEHGCRFGNSLGILGKAADFPGKTLGMWLGIPIAWNCLPKKTKTLDVELWGLVLGLIPKLISNHRSPEFHGIPGFLFPFFWIFHIYVFPNPTFPFPEEKLIFFLFFKGKFEFSRGENWSFLEEKLSFPEGKLKVFCEKLSFPEGKPFFF